MRLILLFTVLSIICNHILETQQVNGQYWIKESQSSEFKEADVTHRSKLSKRHKAMVKSFV